MKQLNAWADSVLTRSNTIPVQRCLCGLAEERARPQVAREKTGLQPTGSLGERRAAGDARQLPGSRACCHFSRARQALPQSPGALRLQQISVLAIPGKELIPTQSGKRDLDMPGGGPRDQIGVQPVAGGLIHCTHKVGQLRGHITPGYHHFVVLGVVAAGDNASKTTLVHALAFRMKADGKSL